MAHYLLYTSNVLGFSLPKKTAVSVNHMKAFATNGTTIKIMNCQSVTYLKKQGTIDENREFIIATTFY